MIPFLWLEGGEDQTIVTLVEPTDFLRIFVGGPLGAKIKIIK